MSEDFETVDKALTLYAGLGSPELEAWSRVQSTIESKDAEIERLRQENAELHEEAVGLTRQRERIKAERDTLKDEVERLREEADHRHVVKVEDFPEYERLRDEVERLRETRRVYEQALEDAAKRAIKLETQNRDAYAERDTVKAEAERLRAQAESDNAVIAQESNNAVDALREVKRLRALLKHLAQPGNGSSMWSPELNEQVGNALAEEKE